MELYLTVLTNYSKIYYYLIFRDGDKVITKYVGKDEASLISLREQLVRRKQIDEIIKKLKKWKNYRPLYEWMYEINLINK